MTTHTAAAVLACFAVTACAASDDTGDELGELTQHADVTDWQNVVNVTVAGNALTKTGGGFAWDAGASSVATLATDGYLEFTATDVGGYSIGLSNGDATVDYREIDHAFHLTNAIARIRENGALRGTSIGYEPGDRLRIQVTRGVVSYLHASAELYTSALAPAFPVRVDASLYRPGGMIDAIKLVSQGVTWQNVIGVATTANSLVKTAPENTFAAGASSVETIGAIGYVEATTDEITTTKAFGLSRNDATQSLAAIEYAFYLAPAGALRVYERGVNRGTVGTYAAGDWLRVEAGHGRVRYLQNGAVVYTSTVAPKFPLRADTSLKSPGATLRDVVLHDAGFSYAGGDYIKASNPGSADSFGSAVAIAGTTLAVGAIDERSAATGINGDQDDDSLVAAGAAYVLVETDGVWAQQAYVKASNTDAGDWFGYSVALSGDTLVVGAPNEASAATGVNGNQADDSMPRAGAVYVFVRTGTTWTQQAYLKASNTEDFARFGEAVAIAGNRIVVGAPTAHTIPEPAGATGAAYVFRRSGTTWTQEAYLTPAVFSTQFGASVAIDAGTIAIGATYGGNPQRGNVQIFERPAGTWVNTAIVGPAHASQSAFGAAISLSGGTLAVGGILDTDVGRSVSVFVRSGSTWTEQAYLAPPTPVGGFMSGPGGFGLDIDVLGDRLVAAFDTESTYKKYSGAVYLYERTGTTWGAPVLLKAPNADPFDQFGTAVQVTAGRVVVGARFEAGGAAGVNGDMADNSRSSAGAVYVLE